MGFPAKRKLYLLVFEEDSDLYGLEITAKGTTLGERKSFIEKYPDEGNAIERLDYEAEFFVEHVTSWNLEDESGNPQPISVQALDSLDGEWVKLIITTYTARSFGKQVNEDLGKESSSGASTETTPNMEESLPMEPLP